MTGLPAWLEPVRAGAAEVTGDDVTRFLPPDDADPRRGAVLMLFTGDPLPDVDRRSLAIEPMTCPPNAFRTGEDRIRLEAGQSFTSAWGIEIGP